MTLKRKKDKEKEEKMVAEHKITTSKLRWKQYYLTKKNNKLTEKLNSTDLCDFVNEFLKGTYFENCVALVLELVHSGDMFGDAGKKVGMEFARQSVKSIISA